MDSAREIDRFIAMDKKYVWHPFTQMQDWLGENPLIIEEGRDCFLKDSLGRWYLDGVSSLWVTVHGHRKKEVDDAIAQQLTKIAHSTLLGLSNIPSITLAERLLCLTDTSFAGLTPQLSKVFYSDDGSTAVEVALKMAFQYWIHSGNKRKNTFLSLRNAYHGDTLGAVSVGGIDIFHSTFRPLLFKTYKAPSPYCYRCEFHRTFPGCSLLCLGEMKKILEKHAEEIAGLIVEPVVQAAGGIIVSPPGYLRGVRNLCNEYHVLMIADEVATGFGRTGKMFACEHESVVPDIMCLSKGITNGYLPLAATLTHDAVYAAFLGEFSALKTFFHGHSYTGNPLSCAAANACIDLFRTEDTLRHLPEKIAVLEDSLREIADIPRVGNVRNKGLITGIELVRDSLTKEPFPWEQKIGWKVAYKAREDGVLIRPLGNVIVVMPPLCISSENIKNLMNVIKKSIMAVATQD